MPIRPLSAQIDEGGRASLQLLACLSKLIKVRLTDMLSWVRKVNKILFFFFPSTSKKRLWKESCAWAITFPRSVLWPSINSQPHGGDSLHITSAISFHCDAAQVLYVTAGLMHNSLAATCDTQAAMCVPCEEALKVRDSLIHEHSCNCTTQKCKETDKTWAILLYEVLHGSSLNAA